MFTTTPDSWFTDFLVIGIGVLTALEHIAITVLLYRGMPSQLRGIMGGMTSWSSQAGKFVLTLVGGQMFDLIGRNAPFVFIGSLDIIVAISAIIMICMGKLANK